MKVKVKKKLRQWTVAEKLEAVQARKRGLTLDEVKNLFGVCYEPLCKWTDAYETGGIAALEQTKFRNKSPAVSPKVESAEKVLEEVAPAAKAIGVGKAQGLLYRNGFLQLARETVRKLLRRNGHEPLTHTSPRRNKPKAVRHFERATANELWQTDIMSFMLKGQYRTYLIGFMDDHSRFLVGWGLYRFQTAANVMEVFRAAIEKHGMPKEVLSDNGRQYYTWRGKSKFTELLTKLGIRHIRSRPYHPQTLGKIESFWRNLFQECMSQLPLSTFEEAKDKIGEYIEFYNFQRPHQGIGNLMPSDRFYGVGDQVKQIIRENTAQVSEQPQPVPGYTPPAYLVGNLGGKELRVVAKEAQVTLEERGGKMVESSSDGERGRAGGSETATPLPIVEQNANAGLFIKEPEAENGGNAKSEPFLLTENQTAQPAGTAGLDSTRAGQGPIGGEPLSAGGDLQRIVLPVAATGAVSGTERSASSSAGSQDALSVQSEGSTSTTAKEDPESGEEKPEAVAGEGSLARGGGHLAADHPTAGLGSDSGAAL